MKNHYLIFIYSSLHMTTIYADFDTKKYPKYPTTKLNNNKTGMRNAFPLFSSCPSIFLNLGMSKSLLLIIVGMKPLKVSGPN